MNNLFDFATKELSQDAFLRWLIECANDNDAIAPVSKAFLKWLTGRDGEVKVVRTIAQWHRIDIVAELFYPATRATVLLAIEDKVDSEEHDNQLKRYGGLLDPQNGKWNYDKKNIGKIRQTIKVFYKTACLDSDADERNRVVNAGWTIFELNGIATFFNKYLNFENSEIIRHYAAHILRRQKDSKEISLLPMTEWNIVNFQTWFREKLRPFIRKELPDLILEGKIYQGHYFSCYASRRFENQDDRGVCLEIIMRPEDENGIGGVLYPRNSVGRLPIKDAWNVSDGRFRNYRDDLLAIIDQHTEANTWSAFAKPKKNATVRIGSFKETISLDGETPDSILPKLTDILEEFYWLFDANRTEKLPNCRRATVRAYSEEASQEKPKNPGKGKIKSNSTDDNKTDIKISIDKIIDHLLPDIIAESSEFYQNEYFKDKSPHNFFSRMMDKLLPPLQGDRGYWTGKKGCQGTEIYRFWMQPMTKGRGVRITLELAPGADDVDKMDRFNLLPEDVRTNMRNIGGEDLAKWFKETKNKFTNTIGEKTCEPTRESVLQALRELLRDLEEWQKDQLTFFQSVVRMGT